MAPAGVLCMYLASFLLFLGEKKGKEEGKEGGKEEGREEEDSITPRNMGIISITILTCTVCPRCFSLRHTSSDFLICN